MRFVNLLLFLCLLLPLSSMAGTDLLSATVPIADDTPEARQAAMAEALHQVLKKASGQRLSGKGEKLQAVLAQAEDQAQEFRYRDAPGDEGTRKLLWVRFDRRSVEQDLRRLGLILWEHGRPEVVPWLAISHGGRRRLADPERDQDLFQALRQAAGRRGLKLVLPLLDLEDRNALQAGDLWMVNADGIRAASARYGKALPLIGRIEKRGGRWKARWALLFPDGERNFESRGKSLSEVVSQGLGQVADELVRRYLPSPEQAQRDLVRLRIMGVRDIGDYARLRRLLGSLDVVTRFALVRAEGDSLLFRVETLGGTEALANQLSLAPELAPAVNVPDQEEMVTGMETLSYVLR